MNHFRLRETKSLKELNPDIESKILECRVGQMRQRYEQQNGTPQLSSTKMEAVEKDNKTANGEPSATKKYNGNGLWTKNNWTYVVEVPPSPPNEFEFLGLRPRKPPPTLANSSQYLKPTTNTKRKFVPKATTTSVKTTPPAMKGPLKRSFTDGNVIKRRWSQENPLHHLLQMMEQSKSTPATRSQKKTGPKSEEGRTMLLAQIKQENGQMDDGENADKTINKDHEEKMGTKNSEQPKAAAVEQIRKKPGRKPKMEQEESDLAKEEKLQKKAEKPKANRRKKKSVWEYKTIGSRKKGRKAKKGGRVQIKKELQIEGEEEMLTNAEVTEKKKRKPRQKRVWYVWEWEPIPPREEPVAKKPRTRNLKPKQEPEEEAETERMPVLVAKQPMVESKPQIQERPQVQNEQPIMATMENERQEEVHNVNEAAFTYEVVNLAKYRELPHSPLEIFEEEIGEENDNDEQIPMEIANEEVVAAEEEEFWDNQGEFVEEGNEIIEMEEGEMQQEELENDVVSIGNAEIEKEETINLTNRDEYEEEEGVAGEEHFGLGTCAADILQKQKHYQQMQQEEEEDLPQIPVEIAEQLSPPPLSSASPIQATSPLNQISDPELAKLIEKKQNSMRIDEYGNLICYNGNLINNRFDVYKNIGEGVFAQVYLVKDRSDSNKNRALKIIRNTREYRMAAQQEVDILLHFDRIDPEKKEQLVIRMLESFELPRFKNFCILFRAYGQDVYKFMEKNHFHPFPLSQIRYMAYQLIHATDFLHKNRLTHTDLKPENILFVNSTAYDNVKPWHRPEPPYDEDYKTPNKIKVLRDATICLIDMGSAVFDHQAKDSCVSTRHYRAPEILLKLGWNQSCDVWSLGCIFFELYTGHPLIPQIMDITHLAVLERIFGKNAVPNAMRKNTTTGFYNNKLKLDIEQFKNDDKWKKEAPRVEEAKPLINYIYKKHKDNPGQHEALFDLIARMLIYEPARRAKLADCQREGFFAALEPELRAKVDRGGRSDSNERQDSKHPRGKNVKRAAPKAEDHHHYQKATEHRRHHHESGGSSGRSSRNQKRRHHHSGNGGEHDGWNRAGPSGGR